MNEFLEDEAKEKKRDYEGWNLNKDEDHSPKTLQEMIQENQENQENPVEEAVEEINEEEEDEEIGEMIERQFARPEKDDMDCESICSTYSNLLNHPKLIGSFFYILNDCLEYQRRSRRFPSRRKQVCQLLRRRGL